MKLDFPKIVSIIVFSVVAFSGKSQVSLNYNTIGTIDIRTKEIFNVTIINSTLASISNCTLKGVIYNASGKKIIEAVAANITIAKGFNNIGQINIPYTSIINDETLNKTNILSYGKYRFDCKLINPDAENLAEGETEINVTPLSPPMLSFPENDASIDNTLPLLNWIPPIPTQYNSIVYELKVSEILPSQTAFEAISSNNPILNKQIHNLTSYQYAPNNFPLNYGKNYAWQIAAKNNNDEIIGYTEIWNFRIAIDNKFRYPDTNYIVLNNKYLNRIFNISNRNIYIQFEEKYNQSVLDIKVFDEKMKKMNCDFSKLRTLGDNRIIIDLSSCNLIESKQYYTITISTNKNTLHQIKIYLKD